MNEKKFLDNPYLQGAKNTDAEIWRKVPDDYYSPSIRVTENGDIRICVSGYALMAPVEQWFSAGEVAFCVDERPNKRHLTALRGFLRRLLAAVCGR